MENESLKQTKPNCSKTKQKSQGCINCPLIEICKKFKNK
jgi:hypothetical protein